MESQIGPEPCDEGSILYQLQRKVKVFSTNHPLPNRGYNLVASASKYEIVFIGCPDGKLAVYYLNQLIDKQCDPQHLSVQLQESPSYIAVSCDHELLAVIGSQLIVIYRVKDFQNQNVAPVLSMKCDVNPSTFVSDLKWNPCIPDTIAVVFFDGTLIVLQASSGQIKKVQSKARCLCWSPKGKQLVVGNSDGSLCQYKPDLSPMKMISAPKLFGGAPIEVLAIYWIATYQFAVVYKNSTDNSPPAVTIAQTPKGGQPSCLNYEDCCYSIGSNRPWYYYLQGLPQWNIIICASSNSMEMATLGSRDGASWIQWCQTDETRPELPFTDKKQENYPVGICIDTAAIHQLSHGENELLPHMPLLLAVSQTGLLVIFNIVNLQPEAPQICISSQQLALPAGAMKSLAVEPAPSQPQPSALAAALQDKPAQPPLPAAQPVPAAAFAAPPQPIAATQPQAQVPKPPELKPAVQAQPPAPQAQKPAPVQQKDQTQEINAALKAEQELANKQKADQELKSMLIREVNEFKMELYKFVLKTRQSQMQFYRDLLAMTTNADLLNIDAESIKKECDLDDLRNTIIAQKLDLVRACAVVAEARTHSNAKDLDQWTQADPLTTKRVASVKKLAYYVQSQLDQAHHALDYKWNQQIDRDLKLSKPGHRMTRPILDDVYQPLVRQQEILGRQQAMLKTLRSTLNECNVAPTFKSTHILRTTPFKDPLSKLTKNILNMSIEPQKNEDRNPLTPQKLDALRDMLSNHKTIKIKPVNVEMRHHLAAMRTNYEKEKAGETLPLKLEPQSPVQSVYDDYAESKALKDEISKVQQEITKPALAAKTIYRPKSHWLGASDESSFWSKGEPSPGLVKPAIKAEVEKPPAPSFTPIIAKPVAVPPVARTLFTSEPEKEPIKPLAQTLAPKQPLATTTANTVSDNTRSLLKDMLQTKQVTVGPKLDDMNSFMGQKICSPSSFNFSSVIVATPTSFTSKPISELNNMFNQFSPQTFGSDPKSNETGESVPQNAAIKEKEEKQMTNLFAMKTSTPLKPSSQNVADVLASSKTITFKRVDVVKPDTKPDKSTDKSRENVPHNTVENVILSIPKIVKEEKKDEPKATQAFTSAFAASGDTPKPLQVQSDNKTVTTTPTLKSEASVTSSSKLGSANGSITVPKPPLTSGSTAVSSSTPAVTSESVTTAKPKTTSAATSLFANTASTTIASPTKTEPVSILASAVSTTTIPSANKTESGSIFSAASSTPPSIFGTSNTSLFGAPATTQSSIFAATSVSEATKITSENNSTTSTSSTPTSVFGSSAKSVFSSAFATTTTSSPAPVSTVSTASSVFGSDAPTPSSVFGAVTATTQSEMDSTTTTTQSLFSTPAVTSASIFGSATSTTQPSVFGGTPTQSSLFGTPKTQSSVFGATTTTQSSVFGATTTTQPSVFGSTTTTQSSVFGATTTTQPSVFGVPTTTQSSVFGVPTTTQSSVFGASTTTQSSVFGTPATTQVSSVFGSPATTQTSIFGSPATTQASVFGSPTTTQASVFGAAPTTQASVFGSPQTTQASVFGSPATQTSVFGTPTQANQTSVFGAPAQASVFGSPAQTQASIFGSPTQSNSVFGTPTQTTQSSVFGTPTPTTQASVFGSPAQGSVFGAPATTASSMFGGGETLSFGSVNISSNGAPAQSGESIFGNGSSGSSVFGSSNNNVFGGKSTFGQSTPSASSIFGGAASFGQTAPTASLWGSNNNTGGGFGSTGFGQQPTTQSSSVFGTGSFSTPQAGQGFGSSPSQQSGGFGSGFGGKAVFGQPTGFGSPTAGSGFGAPAAFGGFGKSPGGGFGAAATFGGGASFGGAGFGGGSPGSVFGGSTQAPGFGSPTQSNATFESLATQNTLTFGNLAQQTPQQAQPAPSFNTSPSFTGWRG